MYIHIYIYIYIYIVLCSGSCSSVQPVILGCPHQLDFVGTPVNIFVSSQKCQGVPFFPQSANL